MGGIEKKIICITTGVVLFWFLLQVLHIILMR